MQQATAVLVLVECVQVCTCTLRTTSEQRTHEPAATPTGNGLLLICLPAKNTLTEWSPGMNAVYSTYHRSADFFVMTGRTVFLAPFGSTMPTSTTPSPQPVNHITSDSRNKSTNHPTPYTQCASFPATSSHADLASVPCYQQTGLLWLCDGRCT